MLFTPIGRRAYNFTITTYPRPDQLATALEYRFEAAEVTRAEVEAIVGQLPGGSTAGFVRDLELAFADLTASGFHS